MRVTTQYDITVAILSIQHFAKLEQTVLDMEQRPKPTPR